jgi:hypothetical protein
MTTSTPEDKPESIPYWMILLAIFIGIFLYLVSRFQVKDANEKLTEHLNDKLTALNDIDARIEHYREEKIMILRIKRATKVFIRFFLAGILVVTNIYYVMYCYPDSITIQHTFECIATLNAALLFIVGVLVFIIFESFIGVRSMYHSIQTYALEFMFKESEEMIESLLKLDLQNREAVRKEMAETEQAIKENEELLNPKFEQEPEKPTTDIISLN